jgi:hypothetical protein
MAITQASTAAIYSRCSRDSPRQGEGGKEEIRVGAAIRILQFLTRLLVRSGHPAEIGGDTRRANGVIANRRKDAGCAGAPADHAPGIGLHNRLLG